MDIYETLEKVEKLLFDEYICANVDACNGISAFTVHIDWGDWKHSHLRAKYLIESNGLGKFIRSETTEEDGSDCYSATHYFVCMG